MYIVVKCYAVIGNDPFVERYVISLFSVFGSYIVVKC